MNNNSFDIENLFPRFIISFALVSCSYDSFFSNHERKNLHILLGTGYSLYFSQP